MKLIAPSDGLKLIKASRSDSLMRNSSFVPSTVIGTSLGFTSEAPLIASVTLIPAHQAKSFTRAGASDLKYCAANNAHASSRRKLKGSLSGNKLDVRTNAYSVESNRFLVC